MRSTLIYKLVILSVAVLLSTTWAFAGADAFNRVNLGPNWVPTSGSSLNITNHQLAGSAMSLGSFNGASTNTAASAVLVLNGSDLEYGAVAVGNIAAGTNAFVKLQEQNGDGMFEYAGFYTGNNSSVYFFQLTTPVPSPAILDVFFCKTVATMRITSAAGVQTYTYDYGAKFGKGAGLGVYGAIGLDNFVGFASGCKDAAAQGIPATQMPRAKDLTLEK